MKFKKSIKILSLFTLFIYLACSPDEKSLTSPYDDLDSFIVDRFIEVKSYEKEISFFWSRNEVQKAQELNEKYYLYLVDRLLMKDEKYIPRVFQNPYEKIFKNELWKKETENWKVTVENS